MKKAGYVLDELEEKLEDEEEDEDEDEPQQIPNLLRDLHERSVEAQNGLLVDGAVPVLEYLYLEVES